MIEKTSKRTALEVSSQSLQDELVSIKERLSAIETIQSISNAKIVERYVQDHLTTKDAVKIMVACQEQKTKSELMKLLGYKSKPALDHHLRPLREADLLRQKSEGDGEIVFEWSNLFRRLPKSAIRTILEEKNRDDKKGDS